MLLIKRMRMQLIPGSPFPLPREPGYEANTTHGIMKKDLLEKDYIQQSYTTGQPMRLYVATVMRQEVVGNV